MVLNLALAGQSWRKPRVSPSSRTLGAEQMRMIRRRADAEQIFDRAVSSDDDGAGRLAEVGIRRDTTHPATPPIPEKPAGSRAQDHPTSPVTKEAAHRA